MNHINILNRAADLIILAELEDKKTDLDEQMRLAVVRYLYSNAWGFYRLSKNYEGLDFCRKKLEATGLSWDDLVVQQRRGLAAAIADLWRE